MITIRNGKLSKKLLPRKIDLLQCNLNLQSEFIINTVPTTNPEVIANSFNDFFVNVGKNLAENINFDIDPLKYIANNLRSNNTIEVTEVKISSIISAIKSSAPGFDELPAFIMKQCSKLYIKPLCHVLSLSIRQGVFPNELKLAKVLPIYKSDDKRQLKNYRPISVLPFISKIFEKVVADSVIDFLEDNDILYNKQFGFRKRHSTTHAIITLTEKSNDGIRLRKNCWRRIPGLNKMYARRTRSFFRNKNAI